DYLKKPVDERFEVQGGVARWSSSIEHGEAPVGAAFYVPMEGFGDGALFVRALRHAPGHKLKLLPVGEAWIEDEATREVTLDGKKVRLTQVAVAGSSYEPSLSWVMDDGEVFGFVGPWFSTVLAGGEGLIPELLAADQAWLGQRSARLAKDLIH